MEFLKSILLYIFRIFNIIFDKILETILELYLGSKKKCVPLTKNVFVTKSASELAKMIREKKIKSYDLINAYIERMKEINEDLNAIVDGPFMEALDQAKIIDERIENGEISENEFIQKPFLGIPFTAKDSTAVSGKLHTLGLISRKNYRAEEDAESVRLMKMAGCVIIATSNVPEANKWMETRNMLIGQTNNPYDTRRSVGGSSGGEAALITACGTAFGLGTDVGGSIRIPAFNCGIFGHKATTGVINMRGCSLRTGEETSGMVTGGPMTRYAEDLLPLFKILVEPKFHIRLNLDQNVDIKTLKYYYIPQNYDLKSSPVTEEMQRTMFKVIDHICKITGKNVQEVNLPGIEKTSNMWRYWMTQEATDYNKLLGNGKTLNPFIELSKKLIGKSDLTLAAIYSLIDGILPKENAEKIRNITEKCEKAFNELLADNGILFFHSSPKTTPFHYYNLLKFNDFHYFSLFNVLNVPVTQVPLGLSSDGLPLGIQVVSTQYNDRYCIAVARELEKAFGGWVQPFVTQI